MKDFTIAETSCSSVGDFNLPNHANSRAQHQREQRGFRQDPRSTGTDGAYSPVCASCSVRKRLGPGFWGPARPALACLKMRRAGGDRPSAPAGAALRSCAWLAVVIVLRRCAGRDPGHDPVLFEEEEPRYSLRHRAEPHQPQAPARSMVAGVALRHDDDGCRRPCRNGATMPALDKSDPKFRTGSSGIKGRNLRGHDCPPASPAA